MTTAATSTAPGVTEFHMPSLGADMEDGIVTEWLIGPGDEVRRGQVIAVVETDKSDIEVEIFLDGTVAELLVPEGDRVAVGTPIARIAPVGAVPASSMSAESSESSASSESVQPSASAVSSEPTSASPQPPASTPSPAAPAASTAGRTITSPLVRHLAEELHLDLGRLHGSGPGGRVLRSDVEHASRRPPVTPRARLLARRHGVDVDALAGERATSATDPRRPVTGDEVLAATARTATGPSTTSAPTAAGGSGDRADRTRRAIANLMTTSWSTIPHYHVASRIDVTAALRRLAAWNESHGVRERILPTALWLHAVARAAAAVPAVNGWWVDDSFDASPGVDLGVVIARRGGGIVVPTIRAADELTVPATMEALAGLVSRVRSNRLRSSDAETASITVTNLGDLGADVVYGVIHPPQVALIGIGRVHEAPWVDDGEIVARSVLDVTVAGDHRATDGLVGATFLSRLATIIDEVELDVATPQRPGEPDEPDVPSSDPSPAVTEERS